MGHGSEADDIGNMTQLVHGPEPSGCTECVLRLKILSVVNSQIVLSFPDVLKRLSMSSNPLRGNEVRHRPHRSIGGRGFAFNDI